MTVCACGCGRPTAFAVKTVQKRGVVKGQPLRFVHGHSGAAGRRGSQHPAWRGGRTMMDGYVRLHRADHPHAHNGYVFEHVLVAEASLGHLLPRGAEPHHCNGDHADNRPENLVLCENHSYHMILHRRLTAYHATGDPSLRQCPYCHEWTRLGLEDAILQWNGQIVHRRCRNAYKRAYNRRRRQELRA